MAICEETFRAGFHFSLHPFIEHLLVMYRLVLAQIHPNTWRMILNFIIKCVEVGLEIRIRAFRSALALKASLSGKPAVSANYRSSALAFLISESLYRWSDSFFFICLKARSWDFGHV